MRDRFVTYWWASQPASLIGCLLSDGDSFNPMMIHSKVRLRLHMHDPVVLVSKEHVQKPCHQQENESLPATISQRACCSLWYFNLEEFCNRLSSVGKGAALLRGLSFGSRLSKSKPRNLEWTRSCKSASKNSKTERDLARGTFIAEVHEHIPASSPKQLPALKLLGRVCHVW